MTGVLHATQSFPSLSTSITTCYVLNYSDKWSNMQTRWTRKRNRMSSRLSLEFAGASPSWRVIHTEVICVKHIRIISFTLWNADVVSNPSLPCAYYCKSQWPSPRAYAWITWQSAFRTTQCIDMERWALMVKIMCQFVKWKDLCTLLCCNTKVIRKLRRNPLREQSFCGGLK